MPCRPVQALALPELTTMACACAALHALGANLHRRGADLVGGEHAGDGGGHFGHDEREVALLALLRAFAGAEAFDVAEHAAGEKALRGDDGSFNEFQFGFHEKLRRDCLRTASVQSNLCQPDDPPVGCRARAASSKPALTCRNSSRSAARER